MISVLMPVYNAERYVAEAVESILEQTSTDFEFLIIDDGSTDRSLEILRKYEKLDQRIRLISRPNTGIVGALNDGLAICRGEFIARMDADDISAPQRFDEQLSYLRSDEKVVAVGSRVCIIDPDGRRLTEWNHETAHLEIDSIHLTGNRCAVLCHPSVMMRRAAVNQVGGYFQKFYPAEDLDLFLRLAEIGRLGNIPRPLLSYRIHPLSISNQHKRHQIVSARAAQIRACERRGLPVSDNFSAKEIDIASDSPEANSQFRQSVRWGWWALNSGEQSTARWYAFRSVRLRPWNSKGWRLLACALRGH